ncbi:MAG: TIGR02171 family protein, partial [Fibrobacter sp.]|nr:TIGR02171 family protein [Fibrobacter sp.]
AYHGGVSHDYRLAVTGNRLLRTLMADSSDGKTLMDGSARDSVWYNGEQACNVSLAADSTKRTLFLDFGGKTGREFVGSPYDVHERILIADSLGNLIQTIAAPHGYAFDHSEWATGGVSTFKTYPRDFAVATLTNNNGSHEKIVMIDLKDSSVTDLVEGTELWHPCLWTYSASVPRGGDFDKVDLDSAALYYENDEDRLIANKMNIFWAKAGYAKVIGLGSSRMSLAFMPNKMTYGAGLNMAAIPSDMDVNYYLAKNYVFNHAPKLKYLVVGLDIDLWSDKQGENVQNNIQGNPGFHYDISHNFWVDSNTKVLSDLSKMYMRQYIGLHQFSLKNGWIDEGEKNSWSSGGFGNALIENDSNWSNKSATYEYSMEELQEIVDMAKEKNVNVIGVIFPQSPDFKKTGAFGRHGMRRSHAKKLIERFKEMEKKNSNFYLLDENKMGDHDYPDSTAYDYDHLNRYGGEILTSRIDSTIQAVERMKK